MRRYLITGASRGIGRAIAVRLAAPGRELMLHGRDRVGLEDTKRVVDARGGRAVAVLAELTRPSEVVALAEAAAGPELVAVVNNAGIGIVKRLEEVSLQEWHDSMAVMATAPFLLVRTLLPSLGRGATIVNVQSIASRRGFAGWGAYCAAKFALEGLSQCMREELRPRGIRVINVYPAATATSMWDGVSGSWPRERMLDPDEVAEAVAFALERPDGVLVESIELGDISGAI
jgi:NAD(P)-dependent dehydrogenase (short-subunit alcohol dehydrogenase family)